MIANIFTALLKEVRSALRAPFWRRLVFLLGARARALVPGIEVHLNAAAPPAIAGPAVRMARLPDFTLDVVTIDEGETEVAPSTAGVWVRAWVLVDWAALLPTAMPRALNAHHWLALAGLPDEARTAYLLHRIGGLDIDQVAWLQACDVLMVERRLAQCLSAIAHHLERPM